MGIPIHVQSMFNYHPVSTVLSVILGIGYLCSSDVCADDDVYVYVGVVYVDVVYADVIVISIDVILVFGVLANGFVSCAGVIWVFSDTHVCLDFPSYSSSLSIYLYLSIYLPYFSSIYYIITIYYITQPI